MIKLKDIVMIHDLQRQGLSIATIARETGFDHKTVRRHLARGLEAPSYGPREPRPCKIDKYEDWLLRRTAEVPGLSARRLLREIRDLGFDGSYTTVTNFLREARPPTPTVFKRRFETPPGRQAQVDFAEFKTVFADAPGVVRKVWRRESRYLLRSNMVAEDPAELWRLYMRLVEIERSFRVLKSDIEIAPVHHRLPDRIRAHALICFLALVL